MTLVINIVTQKTMEQYLKVLTGKNVNIDLYPPPIKKKTPKLKSKIKFKKNQN